MWGLVPDAGPENPQGEMFLSKEKRDCNPARLISRMEPKDSLGPREWGVGGAREAGIFLGRFDFTSTEICTVILKRI